MQMVIHQNSKNVKHKYLLRASDEGDALCDTIGVCIAMALWCAVHVRCASTLISSTMNAVLSHQHNQHEYEGLYDTPDPPSHRS